MPPRRPMGPPPKLPKGRMKEVFLRLMKYIMSKYAIHFIVVMICIVVASLGTVAGTKMLQYLIDDGITPQIGALNPDFSALFKICAIMAGIYIVTAFIQWLQSRLMINVSQGVLFTIRNEMMNKMQSLPLRYFDTNAHGDIMSRYTNDTDTLRQLVSQSITGVVSSIITIIAVFISMVMLSWQLTLIVIGFLIILLQVLKVLGKKSSTYFVAQQKSLGKLNGFIEEMIEGQKVVKVFNREQKNLERFNEYNEELRHNASRAGIFTNIMGPVMGQSGNLIYFFIAVVGAALSVGGVIPISLGVLAAFLTYTRNFTNPITQISQQISSVVMAMAGADRIFTLLDQQPEEDEGTAILVNVRKKEDGSLEECSERTHHWAFKRIMEDGTTQLVELRGHVEFDNVTFGYDPEKPVLKNLSLYAKPGQKIAFVGHTGAGKTTITNLINRFYDIDEGSITYDGIPIREIKKADLRRSLGIVLQDTHLFTGTIMENIRYGRLDATDEEVIEAAKLANADYFIRHMRDGYDTVITGDGEGISQGQRQLLAIARAAVADPPVLILDEATSSIDTRTEAIVQDGMDRLMEGRTVFVIAHRLSTVRNSKAILYLEQGVVQERGNHEDLLALGGKYYQLYTGAFELE